MLQLNYSMGEMLIMVIIVLYVFQVTSYFPGLHGEGAICRWQLSTGATWTSPPAPSGMMENIVVPTLKAFRLQAHDQGDYCRWKARGGCDFSRGQLISVN